MPVTLIATIQDTATVRMPARALRHYNTLVKKDMEKEYSIRKLFCKEK
jgi:hypothetical protein